VKYCDLHVCMSVCLSACISQQPVIQTSQKFSVHVSCGLVSSDNCAIHYVLLVLWIMSCFHIMKPMCQNQIQRYISSSSPGGSTRGGGVAVCNCRLIADPFSFCHIVLIALYHKKCYITFVKNLYVLITLCICNFKIFW